MQEKMHIARGLKFCVFFCIVHNCYTIHLGFFACHKICKKWEMWKFFLFALVIYCDLKRCVLNILQCRSDREKSKIRSS